MAKLYDVLDDEVKYALAAGATSARRLADTMAGDEGQWYGAMALDFDRFARGIYRALLQDDPAKAGIFRHRLDRRLADKAPPGQARRINWGRE